VMSWRTRTRCSDQESGDSVRCYRQACGCRWHILAQSTENQLDSVEQGAGTLLAFERVTGGLSCG
jgi:hypothetical protein